MTQPFKITTYYPEAETTTREIQVGEVFALVSAAQIWCLYVKLTDTLAQMIGNPFFKGILDGSEVCWRVRLGISDSRGE